ncbi:MAG TPA: peptide ABC transporter substrate-binding protein [Nitrospiria bacterium]|nr:peptide ABC transporter substrate-binding protein [Nitrospiria bacterium]
MINHNRIKWAVALALVFASAGLIVRPVARVPPVPDGSTFRMTLSNEPPTLDWNLATDSVSFDVLINLMEGLTEYDEQLRPRPAVARSWEVAPDGRTYLFHLREDARWSDGKPVTAGDFEYSWKRLLDPKTAAEYAYFLYDIEGAEDYNTGKTDRPDSVGVRALDDRRLEVRLRKPIVFFPSITTFMVTFPMRRDVVEKFGERWTEPGHLVTEGPFMLDEWRHEYKLTLGPNPYYYGERPALSKIVMFVVNETATALTLYETGDLEMATLPPEAMSAYRGKTEYVSAPILRGYYYGFNVLKPPFSDPRVRRAFSMAVDRREFPAILKRGEIPASFWIPPGMPYYNPALGLPFDPEGARRLLADAGYPGGRGFPTVTAAFNTAPENSLIAENLQAQWKRNLGVEVLLDNQEWKVYLKQLQTDPPPLFRLGWGADYPDPDNFMNLFTSTSGNNRTRWKNDRYDALIRSAAAEPDPHRRQAAYDEAQRILLETDAAIMPLFVATQNWVIKPYVRGLRVNALELLEFKNVHLERP